MCDAPRSQYRLKSQRPPPRLSLTNDPASADDRRLQGPGLAHDS
ncbi:hypothetical protein [Lysobacter gummosus]